MPRRPCSGEALRFPLPRACAAAPGSGTSVSWTSRPGRHPPNLPALPPVEPVRGNPPPNTPDERQISTPAVRSYDPKMSDARWETVDHYIEHLLVRPDAGMEAALRESAAAGLPTIQVSPLQGKSLQLLVASLGVRRVLEIGTLGEYSAIWMARALPSHGRIVTLEADPRHAEVARSNFARARVSEKIEVRVGPALKTLPDLAREGGEPFDLVFIDADKPNTAAYFDWAMRLARPGAVIVVDNVVRQGALADPSNPDSSVRGMRRFLERVAAEPRAEGTVVQTVGAKGYDGFALVRVAPPTPSPAEPDESKRPRVG